MRFITALAIATTFTATAVAEPFSTAGIGTATSAKFNRLSDAFPDIEETFFAWAQGLMSGINDALEDTIAQYKDQHSIPLTEQKQILRDFCSEHPTAGYRDAVNDLMDHMLIVNSKLPKAPLYPLQRRN